MALCPVILLGLVLGFRGGILKRAQLGNFIALLVVTTPVLRVNTASSFTGIILALGLFSTLDLAERAECSRAFESSWWPVFWGPDCARSGRNMSHRHL